MVESTSHFGDIMTATSTTVPLLLSSEYTPIQRILLTANGNVQRILSAYFNDKVTVLVHKNEKISDGVYERFVDLCSAKSIVKIKDAKWTEEIDKNGLAIGQIFRHFHLLPMFDLKETGSSSQGFWRRYVLSAPGIECCIREEFNVNLK